MKTLLVLIACVLALVNGGAVPPIDVPADDGNMLPRLTDQRIIGGSVVKVTKHPHQISLRYKSLFWPEDSYEHRCGGSIYRNNMIITAAHCIIATVPSEFMVIAGTEKLAATDGLIVPVKEIIMHEEYNPRTFDNDIALLILGTPLRLNNITAKAIDLADSLPKDGATSIVTGWGTTSEGGMVSNLLQAVQVPIVSNELCAEDYGGYILDSMLCAGVRGVGGKDACQGDSGGPLLVNGKLTGVVSWGYGCAQPNYPGVYSSVPYLRSWILEKAAQYA